MHAKKSLNLVHVLGKRSISFPESSFPLTSGSGYERLWDNRFESLSMSNRFRSRGDCGETRGVSQSIVKVMIVWIGSLIT